MEKKKQKQKKLKNSMISLKASKNRGEECVNNLFKCNALTLNISAWILIK